jgi:MFS family permease
MSTPSSAPNIHAQRLLWAGFMAILAEGVGFGVRGGILGQWSHQYGFTMTELGEITGGGLTGFGVIIIIASLVADRIGYGTLMVAAFLMHVLSAIVTLGARWKTGGDALLDNRDVSFLGWKRTVRGGGQSAGGLAFPEE